MHTLLSPLHTDTRDTDLHTDTRDADLRSQDTAAATLELDQQPVSDALCGEMLDVELPWCSFEQEFRGYAQADWWSTPSAGELALSFA
jgi:hypothetical protein